MTNYTAHTDITSRNDKKKLTIHKRANHFRCFLEELSTTCDYVNIVIRELSRNPESIILRAYLLVPISEFTANILAQSI